ncbi:hypothetical protein CHU92_04855 [Flavobacterium cyanobacteriorum]|uniref:Secretion system C-terminal sorting domain-containing protein n=1 Tax=Flavobacterium cyanobacteriorum TaxID=2022802 RepID=A0A255ZCD5_9FLAO|nr:T9SS type A sorting domain-containing protein [Flavobacterium cyanobacteriorum]OYQ38555.1 hypothetical protein CHU92_04855 [Flavobacterium cyanobacteriorum]
MKTLYFASYIFFILSFTASAQIVNIPDANFKARLLGNNSVALNPEGNNFNSTADANGNGEIELSEALAVTGLRIHTITTTSNDITSFEGLQYFTNLKNLWCSDNPVGGTLNVSMLTQLKYLACNNAQLTGVILPNPNVIEEISLAGNNLTSLNTVILPNLRYLDIAANNLTTLDMTPLAAITYLEAGHNPITSINLTSNNELIRAYLDNTQLTLIDASLAPALRTLHCSNNPNLTTINVKNNLVSGSDPDMLDFAYIFENLPALTHICLDNNEQYALAYTNYNSSGNVTVYTGDNCDIIVNVGTNGISEYTTGNLRIYPNPVASALHIEDVSGYPILGAEIYNTLGQAVTVVTGNAPLTQLDVSSLSPGTYLVKILSDKGSVTKKMVKI